jgi:hypothetical protein
MTLRSLRSLGSLAVAALILAACSDSSATTGPSDGRAIAPTGASFSGSSGGGGGGSTSGGGGQVTTDVIKVGKHSYDAPSHELLVSASSSDGNARLSVYAQSGAYIGEVQNGGGGQYGGSVFFSMTDPVTLTIKSSSGGSITVATVPFVP